MICLDTNFIIDLLNNNSEAVKKVGEIEGEVLATTSINAFEVFFGIYTKKGNKENELTSFKNLLDNLEIFNFNLNSAFLASKIKAELQGEGKQISPMDSLVAGTIYANHCNCILTDDKHFSRIKGLKVESY